MAAEPTSASSPPAGGREYRPLPRPLLWLCLAGLALALAWSGYTCQALRQSRCEFRQMLAGLVEKDQRGASFFRLKVDPADPQRYRWKPLFISPLHLPEGPLPGKQEYKTKALAVLDLERGQRLYFRIRANDGVSVFLQHQRVFDEWRPVPMGIVADFTEDLSPGLNLLEVDYYLGHNKGVLEVRVLDGAGRDVPLRPLKLGLDAGLWQDLLARQALWQSHLTLGLALALVCLLLLPVWHIVRNPHLPGQWYAPWRRLAPGFWTGLGAVMLWQMAVNLNAPGNDDLLHFLFLPLAGGLAGAAFMAGLAGLRGPRPGLLGDSLERLHQWYLAREAWLTPLVVFGAMLLFLSGVITVRGGTFPGTWLHAPWDAQQYKDIMVRGYVLQRTETGGLGGNFAWHPFFSLLARGLYLLGFSPDWAILLMAWLATATAFVLLFRLARDLFGVSAARWSVLSLACYPGAFFLLIGFPYGTAISLGAGMFLALRTRRHWLAALLGYCLGMTYPTAVVIGLLPVFMLVPRISRAERPWPEVRALLLVGASPALGLATLCLHHWWRFGDFFLPLTSHAIWGRQAQWPWDALIEGILREPAQYPEAITTVAILVSMLIFAHRFHPALWAYAIAIFVAGPATGSLESVYRQYLMAWPLFVLMGSSPRSRWLKAAVLWMFLYFALTWYLPLWLTGDLV